MKRKSTTKNVIFIGDSFYTKSHSVMSSIYTVSRQANKKTYTRYDFGFLQIDLSNGVKVNMRKANKKELAMFTKMLTDVVLDLGKA